MNSRGYRERLRGGAYLSGVRLALLCGVLGAGGIAIAAPPSVPLPVPCLVAGACGATGPSLWLGSGAATLTSAGNQLTVSQSSQSTILNWHSFNIGAGGKVTFVQPSSSSVALNNIYQANPLQIFGALNANGVVYLLNQNGILFGQGAQINVGGLVASSLALSPAALSGGIATAIQSNSPAFQPYTAADGSALPSGDITVQSGATLTSNEGQILLFAPNVTNSGLIQTPNGQTILGAGQYVLLASTSANSSVRGLLIQVGNGGTATNLGQLIADTGNATLAGLAVNQDGIVSATTSVRANGSIVLQAQSWNPSTALRGQLIASQNGTVTLGQDSTTEVTLEGGSSELTASVNAQPQSSISMTGANIDLLTGASVSAPAGAVTLNATTVPAEVVPVSSSSTPDSSRIYIAPGATIDVSGAQANLPMSDNELTIHLTSTELANFPIQKASPLLGENITVDLRDYGTNADGTTWVGTPLADLSSDIAAIQQNVYQRSLTGGSISFASTGSVLVAQGATLNVAGGQVNWQSGYINPSVLIDTFGHAVPIAQANPDQTYLGTLNSITVGDPRWGATTTATLPGQNPNGEWQAGYVQGASAGQISMSAPVVVLDGSINGATVTGPLQRMPATGGTVTYNQIPLGASLVLGLPGTIGTTSPEVLGSITFAPGEVLPTLQGPSGAPFNPLTDPLPAGLTSQVRPDLIGPGAITQLAVNSSGEILLPAGVTLDPGAGGSVALAGGLVHVDGTITAPAGSITLLSGNTPFYGTGQAHLPETYLGPAAVLAATGEWVNDNPIFGADYAPLLTQGGSIGVSSIEGSLVLSSGALLDVTAGAQETASASIVAGHGGSISVSSNPEGLILPNLTNVVAATLRGFAVGNGAKLSVSLPGICLSHETCATSGALRIDPSLLTSDGFGSVSLTGNTTGVTVGSDVSIDVVQQNLQLNSMALMAPSGTPMSSITTITTLPVYERHAENLSLTASTASTQSYPTLAIESGASLTFDPKATVTLTSLGELYQDGKITAPDGAVNLNLEAGQPLALNQGIWLGSNSQINVSGDVVYQPSPLNITTGTVLPGGSIGVSSNQGFVYALPGSSLLASGTSAALYVPVGQQIGNAYVFENVATAGGSISFSATTGLFVGSVLQAQAGNGTGAAGGALSLTLLGQVVPPGQQVFPEVAAQLDVTNSSSVPAVTEGAAAPIGLIGQGIIPAATIASGGFDQVAFTTRNLINVNGNTGSVFGVGSVVFDPGVTLSPAIDLAISSPEVRIAGPGTVNLNSAYVALGSNDTSSQAVNTNLVGGAGTLNVNGQLIDLIGNQDLQGFNNVNLTSSGDIRAVGVLVGSNATTPQGSLTTAGDLTLKAQQIYPSTLTNYTLGLVGSDANHQTLTVLPASGAAGQVLSAGGALTLQASTIVNSGVIRAPIGSITLEGPSTSQGSGTADATTVTLSPGSVLSVSAEGATIPFGQTQAGLAWVYAVTPLTDLIYGTGALPPPQKQISINAQQLNFESGAKVDVSGGGDLLAYEWTPGVGGTNDVLSSSVSVSPNTYAVLPASKLSFAPYDPLIDQDGVPQPNQSVYLSGGGGLAAGTYALLPARYALLPGAYLVTEIGGYANITPGQQYPQLDGSLVVSGHLLYSGTALGQTQTSGFDIAPGTFALKEAQYTTTSANSFFSAQASAAGQVSSPLPQDAGHLAIQVTEGLNLSGTLAAAPGSGGRGGELDVSATNLDITNGPLTAPAGEVAVEAQQIDKLGATVIVLGGTSSISNGTDDINVLSNTVTVDDGASLSSPEVLLVANQVQIATGATLQASGTAVTGSAPLSVPTSAAIVGVSTGSQSLAPSAASAGAGGNIAVAQGATIGAPGSVIIAANNGVDFEGALRATGASVTLESSQIALGTVPQSFVGFALSTGELPSLNGSNLMLLSPNALQIYGPTTLTVSQLLLDAPGIGGASADANLNVSAGLVTLQDSSTTAAPTLVSGNGALSVAASHLDLGTGAFAVTGFGLATLSATEDLSSMGNGTLQIAGNTTLNAGVFQSTGAYTYAIAATGQLSTTSPTPTTASAQAAAGSTLTLQAASVSLGGNVYLPAGALSVSASTGDIEVLPQATLNLGGQTRAFAGLSEGSAGGAVSLQAVLGSVSIDAGSSINIGGGSGASGGSLSIIAPYGTAGLAASVQGAGGAGAAGGALTVESQSLDFPSLVVTAAASGLTGAFTVHERGAGDLDLGSGQQIIANNVSLTADQGSVEVDGLINASTIEGGAITLNAQNDVVVNGSLLATASANAARGGVVELTAASGGVYLNSGSLINVGGEASTGATLQSTGELWITASRGVVSSVLNADPTTVQLQLNGSVLGAAQTILEANQAYALTSGSPSSQDVSASATNPYYQDAATFMLNAPAIAAALGHGSDPTFQVLPGVELDTTGDLTIANALDLSTWRFGAASDIPGVLTLRATGNIFVDAPISDGFPSLDNGQGAYVLSTTPGPSWSYRITAGADLSSADPMGTAPAAALPSTGASVVLAPGVPADPVNGVNAPTVIRTGTGSIQIAAAQDLVLGNQASVIYTAGEAGPGYILQDPAFIDGLNGLVYPVNGGSIHIQVGQDVIGATSNQLFTDWLWRTGEQASAGEYVPTAWTVNFGSFEQGIGALGGGDLTVIAGGNIVDLGAVVPSTGIPMTPTSLPTEMNAGILTVQAGGNILGGKFLDMAGSAAISAGGYIDAGSPQAGAPNGLHPILALGDSQFTVSSRSNLTIEAITDPTLVPQSLDQGALTSYFATYSNQSAVSLLSAGGNVTLINAPPGVSAVVNSSPNVQFIDSAAEVPLHIYAPTLNAAALTGDIDVQGGFDLWPAADGNLNLLAGGNIKVANPSVSGGINIVMSAADPNLAVPTVALPASSEFAAQLLDLTVGTSNSPNYYAPQSLHGGAYAADGEPDTMPARIVALAGDLSMQPTDVQNASSFVIPKPVDISVGGDIVDLGLSIEQYSAGNVSTIAAGGSLTYPLGRNGSGDLIATNRIITVNGPGDLVVETGGSIDLGTSNGITSQGNLIDPALPSGGASVNVTAGVNPSTQYQAFIAQYLQPGSSYASDLIDYMQTLTGQSGLSAATALSLFEGLSTAQQQPLLEQILDNEVQVGGSAAAATGPTHDNFTQAFDALTAMWPGSNPDLGRGQTDPYQGDIALYFSRIYTLEGGDVSLFAPGGQITVGLATALTAFGLDKPAAQLGLVAQSTGSVSTIAYGDVDVNLSRVFSADGGNILMWSSEGNIDAGRGAKSAISAPPPTITISSSGVPTVAFPPALTGSGIQTLSTTTGVPPGNVYLFAPHGVVNANEAGIVAGNLTIAATAVLGTNNIQVSGTSVGVPVPVTGQGIAAAAAGSSSAAATNAGVSVAQEASSQAQAHSNTPLSDTALAFLEVFVVGLGEESCAPSDVECLKRQQH